METQSHLSEVQDTFTLLTCLFHLHTSENKLRNPNPSIRYLNGTSSNMAIVDVEIPTGYIYTRYRFLDEFVSQ